MKQTIQEKQKLVVRLSGYAVSAGTLLVLNPVVRGEVIYSGPQNIELNMPLDFILIDLDNNLVNDFGFFMYGDSFFYSGGSVIDNYQYAYAVIFNPETGLYGNSWMVRDTIIRTFYNPSYGTTFQWIEPIVNGLDAGTEVNDSQTMWSDLSYPFWPGILGFRYASTYQGPGFYNTGVSFHHSFCKGDFVGNEHFIGLHFYVGTEQHYGWVRVSLGDRLNPMIVVDWAYENVAGVGITTGDAAGVDVIRPVISISGVGATAQVPTLLLTIEFEEEVTGFELNDIIVTNGSAANFIEITAGFEYTVEITADAEGEVEMEIVADAVYDLAGNGNWRTIKSWIYDATNPVVTLNAGVFGPTPDQITNITVSFSEEITGLEIGDFIVTNGSASNLTEIIPGMEFTIDITAVVEGDVTVSLSVGAVNDIAGNTNQLASIQYIYDDPSITGLYSQKEAGIKIYPNPVTNNLHIELENESIVRILNMKGTILYQQDHVLNEIIDMSGFTPGIYIIQVENNNKISQHKFIVE